MENPPKEKNTALEAILENAGISFNQILLIRSAWQLSLVWLGVEIGVVVIIGDARLSLHCLGLRLGPYWRRYCIGIFIPQGLRWKFNLSCLSFVMVVECGRSGGHRQMKVQV